MSSVRKHRQPLFLFALVVILACTPKMVRHSGEEIIKGDEPVTEDSRNTLDYGYKDSKAINIRIKIRITFFIFCICYFVLFHYLKK